MSCTAERLVARCYSSVAGALDRGIIESQQAGSGRPDVGLVVRRPVLCVSCFSRKAPVCETVGRLICRPMPKMGPPLQNLAPSRSQALWQRTTRPRKNVHRLKRSRHPRMATTTIITAINLPSRTPRIHLAPAGRRHDERVSRANEST